MNIQDFIGETTEYDKKLKLETKKPKSWLKSVSAFANTLGGVLIFGVSDSDELIGLDNTKEVMEIISEQLKSKMDPVPEIVLKSHDIDDKEIVTLEVFAGDEMPYYYVGDGLHTAFVRIGNESVNASSIDLKRLVLRGKNRTYDSLESGYDFVDFAFSKLRAAYHKKTQKSMEDNDFESFGILEKNGGLTNAGALFADESPVYCSRVFCTRWNGIDKAAGVLDAIDDAEYSGSLILLLEEVVNFVKRNTKKMWKKESDHRVEFPDYSERSVFECVVNALVHRDYLDLGSEVHIDMFEDRMEIYSPGGMYDGSLIQNVDIYNVPSRRRNPIIADIFNRLDFMERRGSGFRKIKSAYESEKNYSEEKDPVFFSNRTEFRVTLMNLNYNNEAANEATNEATNESANEKSKIKDKIILLLADQPSIKQSEIANILNVSRSKIQRTMKELVEDKRILRSGGTKLARWEIIRK